MTCDREGSTLWCQCCGATFVASNEVLPNPCVSAEALEARALIGLHLLAADFEVGSLGSQSPDLGDMWKYRCPKSPIWSSPCSTSVTSGDEEEYGHNNECWAIEVIGLDWSREVVALFLEDWELGLPHGNGPSLPRKEGCVLGELRVVGFPLSHFSEQDGNAFQKVERRACTTVLNEF